jgi:hydroxypyruvate reductase
MTMNETQHPAGESSSGTAAGSAGGPGRPEIVLLVPIWEPAMERLEREYVVHRAWTAGDRDALLRAVSDRVRVAVTTGLAGFRASDLAPLEKLELVAAFGVGHGTYDLEGARARGIRVTNTPDSTHTAVADLALGLLLAVTRRIVEADRFVRAGRWTQGEFPMGRGLDGKTLGILGMGRIGRRVARRAEGFGLSIAYTDQGPVPDVPYRYVPDLVGLARESDALIVACPLTPETRGIVDGRVLEALGPDGFLVNVARGPIVDEAALISALEAGTIAGAGLDPFWDEPNVPEALRAIDRVVLLPHLGTSIQEIREERFAGLFANLDAFFAGEPLPTPVEG